MKKIRDSVYDGEIALSCPSRIEQADQARFSLRVFKEVLPCPHFMSPD